MRRRTAATSSADKQRFWRDHMEGWQRSGVSQREYCAQQGLSLSTFTLWRRRLAAGSLVPVGVVDFVPLPLPVALPGPNRGATALTRDTQTPIVVLAGGYRVEVAKGFDADTLRAVVTALGGQP